jgi:hypothetical protein
MTPHFFLTPKFVFDEQKNEKVLYWLCYKNVELEPFRVVSDSDKTISSFVSEMMGKLKNKQTVNIQQHTFSASPELGRREFKNTNVIFPAPPKSATIMKMKEVVIDTSLQRVEIKNGRLYIDGSAVSSEGNMFVIERMVVKGNSNLIKTDNSPVTVTGDVVSVTTQNGKVNIKGNVSGNIKVDNGNVVVSGTSGDCFVTNGSAKSESTRKMKEEIKPSKPEQSNETFERPSETPTEDVSDIFRKIDNTLARKPKGRIV